jgi:hypothetical protein
VVEIKVASRAKSLADNHKISCPAFSITFAPF